MEDHGHPVSHSTIIHGYKKAKELIDNDSDYHDILKKAESNI
jgi:chromosomal replication initiation ATPase DnaA